MRSTVVLVLALALMLPVPHHTHPQRRTPSDHDSPHDQDTASDSESDPSERRDVGVTQDDHPRRQHTSSSSSSASGRARAPHWSRGLHDVKKANEHYLKIRTQARCKVPRPQVIKVKEVYPDSSKEYLPRCTILHRCSDDSGCCDHDTMKCVAKYTETVELYFYTLHLITEGGGVSVNGGNSVERLTFSNHTECECQVMPDRPRIVPSQSTRSRCLECPVDFNVRELENGGCSCDCFDKQKLCLRLKRGRESLGDADRRCVESGRCHPPECEYGHYDVNLGRCPRKHERRSTHQNGHNWWHREERD